MDFAMKDFEAGALHSTATTTAAMGDAVNVQHKKSFDIADVDSNEMKLEVIMNALAANEKQQQQERGDRIVLVLRFVLLLIRFAWTLEKRTKRCANRLK